MPKTLIKPNSTDWERVQREAAQDTVIAHTASDGPYDPNDTDAVAAYWQQANIKRDGCTRFAQSVSTPA